MPGQFALYTLLAGLLVGFYGGCSQESHKRLEFEARVKSIQADQQRQSEVAAARYNATKRSIDESFKKRITSLSAELATWKLRKDSDRSVLSEAAGTPYVPPPARLDVDAGKLDRAIENFVRGVESQVRSGAERSVRAEAALSCGRDWVRDLFN